MASSQIGLALPFDRVRMHCGGGQADTRLFYIQYEDEVLPEQLTTSENLILDAVCIKLSKDKQAIDEVHSLSNEFMNIDREDVYLSPDGTLHIHAFVKDSANGNDGVSSAIHDRDEGEIYDDFVARNERLRSLLFDDDWKVCELTRSGLQSPHRFEDKAHDVRLSMLPSAETPVISHSTSINPILTGISSDPKKHLSGGLQSASSGGQGAGVLQDDMPQFVRNSSAPGKYFGRSKAAKFSGPRMYALDDSNITNDLRGKASLFRRSPFRIPVALGSKTGTADSSIIRDPRPETIAHGGVYEQLITRFRARLQRIMEESLEANRVLMQGLADSYIQEFRNQVKEDSQYSPFRSKNFVPPRKNDPVPVAGDRQS